MLLAPDFAPAYVAYAWATLDFSRPPEEVVAPVERAARRALELDPQLGGARIVLANVEVYFRFRWDQARAELDQALALAPEDPEVHRVHAGYLAAQGDLEGAMAAARRAQLVDPRSDAVVADLAWYTFLARRYGEALDLARRALALQPDDTWTSLLLIDAARAAGEPEVALAQADALLERARRRAMTPAPPVRAVRLREFWDWVARRRAAIATRRPLSPLVLALPALNLGDRERALQLLEDAARRKYGWELAFLAVDPRFDPLRDETRFQEILHTLELRRALHAPKRLPRIPVE
jgi:tetratricopeptide (TPR) repeat protein